MLSFREDLSPFLVHLVRFNSGMTITCGSPEDTECLQEYVDGRTKSDYYFGRNFQVLQSN